MNRLLVKCVSLAIAAAVAACMSAACADWPHPVKWDQLGGLFEEMPYINAGVSSTIDPNWGTPTWNSLIAADFLCTETGWVTDLAFYGYRQPGGEIDQFRVTFWTDVPETPEDESHPGVLLYQHDFEKADPLDPLKLGWWGGEPDQYGRVLYRIDLPREEWFPQEGTATDPVVYWVGIQAVFPENGRSDNNWYWQWRDPRLPGGTWGDDAAWTRTTPYGGGSDIPPWANWGMDPNGTISFYTGALPTGWLSLDPSFSLTGIPIPEPGAIALTALAAAFVIARRRKRS
jgi:hypothetical protein